MPRKPKPPRADAETDTAPEADYSAEQEAALEGLARLIVQVLNRELDEQRPDLRRRRIKSF